METFEYVTGIAVREAREKAAMSTTELAELLQARTGKDWHRDKIVRIETGRRQLRAAELVLFAEALRATVDDLLPDTGAEVVVDGAPVHLSRVKVPRSVAVARAERELMDESERHADKLRAIGITLRSAGR